MILDEKLRYLSIGCVALVAVGGITTAYLESRNEVGEVINREDIYCVEAVCLRDDVIGHNCVEVEPKMMKLIISNSGETSRILIEQQTDNKQCG